MAELFEISDLKKEFAVEVNLKSEISKACNTWPL
jgi:hypothetical protein